jgi:hypothetical protein
VSIKRGLVTGFPRETITGLPSTATTSDREKDLTNSMILARLVWSRSNQTNPSDGSDPSLRFSKRQDSINGDDDTSGVQTENTLETIGTQVLQIAFTCVIQKPKVMSPQPLSRDVGINYGMTSNQTSWRGNLSA